MPFSELHCLTNYSFLRSASHPEELVEQAIELGYYALAITDECSLSGIVKAWNHLKKIENLNNKKILKLVIGAEFNFNDDTFVVLVKNKNSYMELCQLITYCRRSAAKGCYKFHPDYLEQFIRTGIILFKPSRIDSYIPKNLSKGEYCKIYLLLQFTLTHQDKEHETVISWWNANRHWKIVASSGAKMHIPERKNLLDTLSAIRQKSTINEIKGSLLVNAENSLRSIKKLSTLYPQQYLENTLEVAKACDFSLTEISYQYPRISLPKGETPKAYLREITIQGAKLRYPKGIPKQQMQQIEKELKTISELQYEYYFLTIYDIVKFAREQNILCQGRGSAANSTVCYCLFITDVDPARVNLLFERFISKRRNEPPDIDIDFDNSRREEVIQYIYKRYGRSHAALAATTITYRRKSAFKDIGKALGIEITSLEKAISNYGWRYLDENWLDQVINPELSTDSHILQNFKRLVSELIGFPRHLSQHVGGFVLTHTPLQELVPIENAAMPDRTIIQWDKTDLESMGLMKVDILALGMLNAMNKSFQYISSRINRPFTLNHIPRENDDKVFTMLQKADSVGLFQIESRAQMNMLPRLKPTTYYDLVVQVAIVRPGPIQGDMVHPYLKRKHGEEACDIPLPSLQPILERTYGVPIFQEQVIALAMHAADFSADEAEDLRRSMATWKSHGHMHKLRSKLTLRLLKKGLKEDYVERICRQIEGFGEYGFPESHAASFAWLAYVSAWLKYYYPTEFLCGLLNSQPMGFYQPSQLIQDAQRHEVMILPVDINHSDWLHKVIYSQSKAVLQLGFCSIRQLDKTQLEVLLAHRPAIGFNSIDQLPKAKGLHNTLKILASANAMQSLKAKTHSLASLNRFQAYWEVSSITPQDDLFSSHSSSAASMREPTRTENLLLDNTMTGLSLNDHPMALLRPHQEVIPCILANHLPHQENEKEGFVAGVVTNRQRPQTSAGVTFLTLEDETGTINVVIWLQTAQRQLKELTKAKLLKVYGRIEKDTNSGVIHIIAYRLIDITRLLANFNSKSRDFH